MNIWQSAKLAVNVGKKWFVRNAPEVLTGASVGMSIAAVVMTVPATTKAEQLIEAEKEKQRKLAAVDGELLPSDFKLTKVETVKAAWVCYIPPALMLGGSITCAILSNRISATRIAALATAYGISEKKLKEYQGKVKELFGEEKDKQVRDEIAKDHVAQPVNETSLAPALYGHQYVGDYLCLDQVTGQYFYSTQEAVRRAFVELERHLITDSRAVLSDLYYHLGLDCGEMGELLGWDLNTFNYEPTVKFSTVMHPQKGCPCLAFDYNIYPMYDFRGD